jgi:soluble lytic murein transglycosylase-like protein
MRSWTLGLVVAVLLFGLGPAGEAVAEVYRWVDAEGVVHLTDSPGDRRFAKYQPTLSGTGDGIRLIALRSSTLGLGRRELRRYSLGALSLKRPGDRSDPGTYDSLIRRTARLYDVPPALVKAVVKTESNFQRHAVSRAGAQGLMQLMPSTASDLGVQDPFSPEENIHGGTRYLRAMIDRFAGDWKHALAAYNAGPGSVDLYGGIPPYRETREYVERVLHYYQRYDGDFTR